MDSFIHGWVMKAAYFRPMDTVVRTRFPALEEDIVKLN